MNLTTPASGLPVEYEKPAPDRTKPPDSAPRFGSGFGSNNPPGVCARVEVPGRLSRVEGIFTNGGRHDEKPGAFRLGAVMTGGGHPLDEVESLLQKAIRRGDEELAIFAASVLDISGYGNYAWRRLRKVASEDVGLAEPGISADIRALFDNWTDERKTDKVNPNPGRLFLMPAVMRLVQAKKSRRVDHAGIAFYEGQRPQLDIPDWGLDVHTARGRRMGRGAGHFLDVGAVLVNAVDEPDPYLDRARAARARRKATSWRSTSTRNRAAWRW